MEIIELQQIPGIETNAKLKAKYLHFDKLLVELRKKELPDGAVILVNQEIEELNVTRGPETDWKRMIAKKQTNILKLLEKELNLVPINHYRNLWLALGIAAFGIPLGVVFAASIGNMGFMGIGLPMGIPIGIAIGSGLDKKAMEEGRQLDWDING